MPTPAEVLKRYADDLSKVDPSKFSFLLDEIPRIIRVRTRLGKDENNGAIKSLSPKYINFREKFSELHSETTPRRSNLTLTGEMLLSIIGFQDRYKFYFILTGGPSGKSNDDKARWAKEGGRPFFNLSPSDKNGLQRKISAIIRETLRDIFKG